MADMQHSALREAYRWLMPERYAEMTGTQDGQQQANRVGVYDHIFDPSGMQALEDGASQIAEAMHPWDQVWARWVPRNDAPDNQREQLEQLAEQITNGCTALLARSNFDGAAATAHKEFLFGTGFLTIDEDQDRPRNIKCTASPAYRWALESDSAGRIQAAFYKMPIRARDTESEIPGGKWSDQVARIAKEDPGQMIDLERAIYWLPQERLWRTCVYEKQTKHEVISTKARTSSLICYRAGLTAGRAWGTGPGLKALPDVKVANKVVEMTLRHGAIAVAGIWMAEDDGVINVNNLRLAPGMVIPKAAGSEGLTPLKSPGDFNVSQLVLEDLRVNIRRAFWVTRIEEREMSATEYHGRLQQQLREQRGIYGQLKLEFAEAVQLRVLDLGVTMGVIPIRDFDQVAEVELTGPLAQDVRGAAVDRVKQAAMDIASIAGPEVAMASLKLEELVPWIAAQRHAKTEMFRTTAELKQLAAMVQQQAAAVQAQQMAGAQPAPQQPAPAGMPM